MDSDELRVAQISGELHDNIERQLKLIQRASGDVNLKSLLLDLHQFQPCPQLLDQYLDQYIDSILQSYFNEESNKQLVCEVFYNFGKIIGIKRLLSYMKTDIELIQIILSRLTEEINWHEEYLLLSCLNVLVLIPFSLDSIDTSIKLNVYKIGLFKLNNSNSIQLLSSKLIGSLISRVDCAEILDMFLIELNGFDRFSELIKTGYLIILNNLFKKDSNLKLINKAVEIYLFLTNIELNENNLEYIIKIYSKISKYLNELDKIDEIENIIEFYDKNFDNKSTIIRSLISKNFTKLLLNIDDCLGIDLMIDILNSTVEQINQPMELIDSNFLHTQLLIIAELLYKDLIDQQGLSQINSILSKTLFFQQLQINYISGSNIRDSSNFIIWALSKSSILIDSSIFLSVFKNLLFVCCFDKELMIRRSSTAALQELIGRHGYKNWDIIYPSDKGIVNSSKNIELLQTLDFIELSLIENCYLNLPIKILKIFPNLINEFIEFLNLNILNNFDNDSIKLSSKSLKLMLVYKADESLIEDELNLFLSKLEPNANNILVVLSELIGLLPKEKILDRISSNLNEIEINQHKSSIFRIESYLKIIYSLLILNYDINFEKFYLNLFNLIRINNESILENLKKIIPLVELDSNYLNKWVHYMKNNNLNSSSVVTNLKNFKLIENEVIELLSEDNKIDSNIKTVIINSISEYLQSNELPNEILVKLINKLDDYTISEQGDVGSKIRKSTILLIFNNFNKFQEFEQLIELKLLRLSSEPLETVRFNSARLLLKFKNEEFSEEQFNDYFYNLLKFFEKNYIDNKEASLEFWKGYIFTGGAIRSTNELILNNVNAFLKFYNGLNNEYKINILLKLASVIKVDNLKKFGKTKQNKLSKQILVGLQFISRIFQLNLYIPKEFNFNGFYIRIFNLHLNTTNLTRLSNSIKIFGYLVLVSKHDDSLKRLCWLCCNHSIPKVRVFASEELYSVYKEMNGDYSEQLRILGDTDWSENGKSELYKDIYIEA